MWKWMNVLTFKRVGWLPKFMKLLNWRWCFLEGRYWKSSGIGVHQVKFPFEAHENVCKNMTCSILVQYKNTVSLGSTLLVFMPDYFDLVGRLTFVWTHECKTGTFQLGLLLLSIRRSDEPLRCWKYIQAIRRNMDFGVCQWHQILQ